MPYHYTKKHRILNVSPTSRLEKNKNCLLSSLVMALSSTLTPITLPAEVLCNCSSSQEVSALMKQTHVACKTLAVYFGYWGCCWTSTTANTDVFTGVWTVWYPLPKHHKTRTEDSNEENTRLMDKLCINHVWTKALLLWCGVLVRWYDDKTESTSSM